MSSPAFRQAVRRLVPAYAAGVWIGAIRQAFKEVDQALDEVRDGQQARQTERLPPHYLIALWEPLAERRGVLSRWPAIAAIAAPDSEHALLELMRHVPAPAQVWLTPDEIDWALIAEIVLRTDRHLEPYHRRELAAFIDRQREATAREIERTYSDRDTGFERFRSRLLDPPDS